MIPYLVMLFCVGAPALFYWRQNNPIIWGGIGLVLVIFVGLRHEVGGDWDGYLIITERLAHTPFLQVITSQEPVFRVLSWLSASAGFGVYGVNLVGAVIFFVGLLSFCATLPNRWLALTAAFPFLIVVAVMSANRQGMAIGVILYAMARWRGLGVLGRSAWILAAGLFHVSALLLLVLTVADLKVSRLKKLVFVSFLALAGVWLISRSESSWLRYTTIYVEQSHGAYARGAFFHLLLNLVPAALMLIYSKHWSRVADCWPLLKQLCILALALLLLSPFMTVAVSRMSLYLFPVSITFVAYLPQFFKSAISRSLVRYVCVLSMALVLAAWLMLSNTAFTYFPYQNALAMEISKLSLPQ